ncbi:hypothetical protein GCM10010358_41840 [Streptomyces minutiscleroticus]|uniref:Uncharacterized protein n=1 Tax=Streptomyces minutiscleroticus TaxID=68238 RepID=A0A918NNW8_9ACTN|nr:hypothetical protein GCM10010358_41840 [Streptomyces minutiscleroticus]
MAFLPSRGPAVVDPEGPVPVRYRAFPCAAPYAARARKPGREARAEARAFARGSPSMPARKPGRASVEVRSCPNGARTCLLSRNACVACRGNHTFGHEAEVNGRVRTGAAAGDPAAGP